MIGYSILLLILVLLPSPGNFESQKVKFDKEGRGTKIVKLDFETG